MMRTLPYLLTTLAAAAALGGCGASTDHWAMPNLVGANLQDAQNKIQQLTGNAVKTTSHDATPADREQAVDRDWKVCNQSAKPGDQITEEQAVDFTVVKTGENCG
jgi:beta-lactam-binding protein with PASTA domain